MRGSRRAAVVLSAIIAGCAPWYGAGRAPCLTGDDPRGAEARRAWREAQEGTLAQRACATESIPRWFRDHSGESDEPDCAPVLLERMEDALFAESPVTYSRLTLARVRAIGGVGDTTDVMARTARVLVRIAELGDDDIGPYQRGPEETGEAPPRALLPRLALFHLATSNLFMNDALAHEWLLARASARRDAHEDLLLRATLTAHYSNALWGHPTRAEDNGSFALLARDLDDVEARLAGPWSPEGFELVLLELASIGYYAERFGHAERAARLVERISSGAMPLTLDPPEARRDLLVAAELARLELASHPDGVRPFAYAYPARESAVYDVGAEWIERELYAARGISCPDGEAYALEAVRAVERGEEIESVRVAVTVRALAEHPAELAACGACRAWIVARLEGPEAESPIVYSWLERALPIVLARTDDESRALARTALGQLALRAERSLGPNARGSYDEREVVARALHLLGRYGDASELGPTLDALLPRFEGTIYQRDAQVARFLRTLAAQYLRAPASRSSARRTPRAARTRSRPRWASGVLPSPPTTAPR